MIATFDVKERGSTPRGMAKRINGMKKESWHDAAMLFHEEMRDKRFTHAHATAADYAPRKPAYVKSKLKRKKHTYPLVFSGDTKRDVKRQVRITNTSNGARLAYAGARVLNYRHPNSQVNAAVEFTTITKAEANQIADKFDRSLDRQLSADQTENP